MIISEINQNIGDDKTYNKQDTFTGAISLIFQDGQHIWTHEDTIQKAMQLYHLNHCETGKITAIQHENTVQ